MQVWPHSASRASWERRRPAGLARAGKNPQASTLALPGKSICT